MDDVPSSNNNSMVVSSNKMGSDRVSRNIRLSRGDQLAQNVVYLAKEEVYQILETCEEKEHYLLISLLWKTGLRISEALKIKKKDINFFDKTCTVVWLKKRKAITRSIPLEATLAYDLSIFTGGMNQEDLVFKFKRKQAFNIIKLHAKLAGITKKVSPHTFRHSFAVHFLKETRDLPALQRLLGHNQINTTMVYLRLAHADLRRSLEQANF